MASASKKDRINLKAIGVIRSPFKKKEDVPLWEERSSITSHIEVFKEYEEGLADIEGFSHLFILYWMHHTEPYALKVIPRKDTQLRGIFATRAPNRPNPIALTVVKLLSRRGNILEVQGLDAFDGSLLLDMKPYTPDRYQAENITRGWLEGKLDTK